MSWMFIEPTDVWFFRDARPFPMGGGHIARGIFPPSPLTLQGALRSAVLGHSGVDWAHFRAGSGPGVDGVKNLIGGPGELGKFRMQGPFVARRQPHGKLERLTPIPMDAYVTNCSAGNGLVMCAAVRPKRQAGFDANWPKERLHPLWPSNGQEMCPPPEGTWLRHTVLQQYLEGAQFEVPTEPERAAESEPRLGIAQDYGLRRPSEGMIYQTEFMRPAPGTGLLVWLDPSVELEPEGWLALGGQARSARYSVCADAEVEPLPALRPAASRIKALLLTPAYFEGGWQPKDGNWARLLRVQRADPVAVALGRPMLLGSRDIANTRHRDMHAYVPAGSVYFFEVDPPLASLAGPLTESPREALDHRCLGFGQVAIGTWDWLE